MAETYTIRNGALKKVFSFFSKRSKLFFTIGVCMFLFLASPHSAFAVNTCVSNASGNWNTAATWTSCSSTVPQTGDSVRISSGHSVVMDVDTPVLGNVTVRGTLNTSDGVTSHTLSASQLFVGESLGGYNGTFIANSSTINLSGTSAVLSIQTTSSIFTYGTSTVNFTGNSVSGMINLASSGSVTLYNVNSSGTGTKTISLANATITIANVFTISAGTVAFSTAVTSANLILSGTTGTPLNLTGGSFTATGNNTTVTYSGNNAAGNTTVAAATYGSLTLNNSSERYQLGGDITVGGTTIISASTEFTSSDGTDHNLTTGGLVISSNALFLMNSSTITITGNANTVASQFTNSSSRQDAIAAGTSTIKFTDTSVYSKTMSSATATFYNLWITGTGTGTYTITGSGSSSFTFNDIKDDNTSAHTVSLNSTIYVNTFNVSGADSSHKISLTKAGGAGVLHKTSGYVSIDYVNIANLTAQGGAAFYAGSHSTDNGGNSGWIFGDPSCTATTSGDWNTGGNWTGCSGGGGIPGTSDNVIVPSGINLTLSTNTATLGNVNVAGSIDTTGSNYAINAAGLVISSTGTVIANGSTITLSGTGAAFSLYGGIFSAGTSTINYTNSSSAAKAFTGGNGTFNNVTFTTGSTGTYTITGNNTFNIFWITGTGTGTFTFSSSSNTFTELKDDNTSAHSIFGNSSTQTVTTFSVSGADSSHKINFGLNVSKSSGVVVANYLTLTGSVASGGASWYAVNSNNGGGGTSGWVFISGCVAITTGNWNTGSNWSGCTGGGGVPAAADTVTIVSGVTTTLDVATPVVTGLTVSGTLDTSVTNYALNTTTLTISSGGTLTANGSTITLSGTSGTLFTNSGTFTAGTSTVDFSGASSVTLNSGSITFYNLTVSGGTVATVKTLGAATTLASGGTLTVSAGTFDPSTYLVTGNGSNTLVVAGGAVARVKASTFTGNYSSGFSSTSFAANSTIDYTLNGTQTVDSTISYVNLTVSTGGTKSLNGSTVATGTTTISSGATLTTTASNYALSTGTISIAGTLTANAATISLSGTGSLWTKTGTFTQGTSTIKLTDASSSSKTFAGGGGTFYNFWISGTGTGAYTISGSNTFSTFKDDNTSAHTVNFTASTTQTVTTWTVSGASSSNKITMQSTSSGSAWNLSKSSGTVTSNYLILQDSHAAGGATWNANGSTNVSGNTGWNFGTVSCTSVATGAWNTSATWDCSHVPATGETVTIAASHVVTMDVNSAVLGSITISGTLTTSASNYSLSGTTITIGSSGTLTANSSTITLSGTSGTLFTKTGTFTAGSSTVVLSGNGSASVNSGSIIFYNLTSSGTGTKTITGTTEVGGVLTVSAGVFRLSSGTLVLSGISGTPIVNSGTISTLSATTVVFSGDNPGGNTTIPSSISYYNLSFNGTDTYDLSGETTVNGSLAISQGTLSAGAQYLNVARDWINSVGVGGFSAGTGRVILNTANDSTITGATTFNDLTIYSTGGKNVYFSYQGGDIITVGGSFVVTGSSGSLVYLRSTSSGSQWHLLPQGSATVDYADVMDGGCESGAITITDNLTDTSIDSGNNDSCWSFFVSPAVRYMLTSANTMDVYGIGGGYGGSPASPTKIRSVALSGGYTRVQPKSIFAEGRTGRIYVATSDSNGELQVYETNNYNGSGSSPSNPKLLTTYNASVSGTGNRVWADSAGNVLLAVSSDTTGSLILLNSSGEAVSSASAPATISDIAVYKDTGSTGYVYVGSDDTTLHIYYFDSGGVYDTGSTFDIAVASPYITSVTAGSGTKLAYTTLGSDQLYLTNDISLDPANASNSLVTAENSSLDTEVQGAITASSLGEVLFVPGADGLYQPYVSNIAVIINPGNYAPYTLSGGLTGVFYDSTAVHLFGSSAVDGTIHSFEPYIP